MICSQCKSEHSRTGQRYCHDCHAAHMRRWRRTHRLTGDAKFRAKARAIASKAMHRGKLTKKPCEMCGSAQSEKHHENYSEPLKVRWLCRKHHLEWHRDHPMEIVSPGTSRKKVKSATRAKSCKNRKTETAKTALEHA